MLKKLRCKFIWVIMAVVTLMLCVLLGLVIFFMGKGMEYQSLRLMQTIAQEAPPAQRPRESAQELRLPVFTVLTGPGGELIKVDGSFSDLADDQSLLLVTRAALEEPGQTGTLEQYNLRYYKARRPMGELIVFADMSSERAAMSNLVKSCAAIGGISFLLFLGLSILLVGWMVRPVEEAWAQQKQFVADASHELKTPLTVIMTNAELLQEYTGNTADQRQFSDNILTMSRQMRGLVEGMLELARVDNGVGESCFAALNLTELIAEGMLPFEPLFFERGLELQGDLEPDVMIRGSKQHLHQLLDILLDNALKYAQGRDPIQVSLRRQGHFCQISVTSPGAALSRQDLKNIFKRFYRVDKARSRNGSYGLGLSIAQRIVEEHRGRIWAESRGGMNTFCLWLPVNLQTIHKQSELFQNTFSIRGYNVSDEYAITPTEGKEDANEHGTQ